MQPSPGGFPKPQGKRDHRSRRKASCSSSSLSLSMTSSSDIIDDIPSTSGCSSEMATSARYKELRKEKVKGYIKELKSMVPSIRGQKGRMGTLSTLQHLVDSIRKIKEEQKLEKEGPSTGMSPDANIEKTVLTSPDCQFIDPSVGLGSKTLSDTFICVSMKTHVVLQVSSALRNLLGYPPDWWRGRVLTDFTHKRDIMTINSCLAADTAWSIDESSSSECVNSDSLPESKDYRKRSFFTRFRCFRNVSGGFSLARPAAHAVFQVSVSVRTLEQMEGTAGEKVDEGSSRTRKCFVLYCQPISSPYKKGDPNYLPEKRSFFTRHSSLCVYTDIHPNAVLLLGYMPQEISGSSIFDLYHPEDMPHLLQIYKRVLQLRGVPFKSGIIRLRTRNGCWVEVETEWSSFINPWSNQLDFIIGQHTVVKGPSNANIFEDQGPQRKSGVSAEVQAAAQSIQQEILELVRQPVVIKATSPPRIPAVKLLPPQDDTHPSEDTLPASEVKREPAREKDESESTAMKADKNLQQQQEEKEEEEEESPDATLLDSTNTSAVYEQLNYTDSIKRFLMSHPTSFSSSSEKQSNERDEDPDDITEEVAENIAVDISVGRPLSCGSSTRVHVSEQEHREEDRIPSPPMPIECEDSEGRDTSKDVLPLTQDILRKHTRLQEKLYVQRASKEQSMSSLGHGSKQVLFRRAKRLKRSRSQEIEAEGTMERGFKNHRMENEYSASKKMKEDVSVLKPPFPITTIETQTTASAAMVQQMETMYNAQNQQNYMGINIQGFQPMYSQNIPLVPVDPSQMVVPGTTMGPNSTHVPISLPNLASSIQWPYYPQAGVSFMPQVMGGFYQPVTGILVPQGFSSPSDMPTTSQPIFTMPHHRTCDNDGKMAGGKRGRGKFMHPDMDMYNSSADDTSSSIMYLLESASQNYSSPNEDSGNDRKSRSKRHSPEQKKRTEVAPWLQDIKWTKETQMCYKMPCRPLKSVLKADREAMKKLSQSSVVQQQLELLLEDIGKQEGTPSQDEEADYLFLPDTRQRESSSVSSPVSPPSHGAQTSPPPLSQPPSPPTQDPMDQEGGDTVSESSHTRSLPIDQLTLTEHSVTLASREQWELVTITSKPLPVPISGNLFPRRKANFKDLCRWILHSGNRQVAESVSSSNSNDSAMCGNIPEPMDTVESNKISEDGSHNNESDGSEEVDTKSCLPKHQDKEECMDQEEEVSSNSSKISGQDKPEGSMMSDDSSTCPKMDHMEIDAKSSASKNSSDITPSDQRSNEENGSSLKESDNCSKEQKSSSESDSERKDCFFDSLFTPLTVRMPCKQGKSRQLAQPFWLQDAEMNSKILHKFCLPSRELEEVLGADIRVMAGVQQPQGVLEQLQELLDDGTGKHGVGFSVISDCKGKAPSSDTVGAKEGSGLKPKSSGSKSSSATVSASGSGASSSGSGSGTKVGSSRNGAGEEKESAMSVLPHSLSEEAIMERLFMPAKQSNIPLEVVNVPSSSSLSSLDQGSCQSGHREDPIFESVD